MASTSQRKPLQDGDMEFSLIRPPVQRPAPIISLLSRVPLCEPQHITYHWADSFLILGLIQTLSSSICRCKESRVVVVTDGTCHRLCKFEPFKRISSQIIL